MIKIKTVLFLFTFSIISTLSLSTAFAQYEPHMQVGLPEGAKVRFGTGPLLWFGHSIVYSPNVTDSLLAVSGGSGIGIWLYDANTLQVRDLLPGPMYTVSDMDFSLDGGTLAVGLFDSTVDLWDVATRTRRKTLTPDPTVAYQDESGIWRHTRTRKQRWVTSVSFGPDSGILAVGINNGTIELWNTATGELHKILAEHHDTVGGQDSLNISFSPDGTTIASATRYTHVHLWDVATGELRAILGKYSGRDSWGTLNPSFSPDGRTLATYNNSYKILQFWGVATGKLLKTVESPPELISHGRPSSNITFTPDGSAIIILTYNKDSNERKLHLWDVATGTLRNTFKTSFPLTDSMSFSPDGNTLASTSYNTAFLLDITTGKLRGTLEGNSLNPTSLISPDGNTLAIGNLLWDISTGTLRNTLKEAGYIQSMSFSPDGSILATGSGTPWYLSGSSFSPNQVHLWDVSTGTLRNILKGHTAPVMSVSFSPDGNTIASGSVYYPPPPPVVPLIYTPNLNLINPEQEKKGELL